MNKQNLIFYSSILIIGYIFLPIVSMNIRLTGIWFLILSFYTFTLIYVKPDMILSKQILIIYLFCLIYFLLAPYTGDLYEKDWFLRRIVPLFVGVSLYTYFFRFSKDLNKQRIIFWFTLVSIFISCITTSIGLMYYPDASRALAGSVGGDVEMALFYHRIGITGYGFITALAYIVPFIFLFYQLSNSYKWKCISFFFGIVVLYTVLKSQYTTQLLLVLIAFLLSRFASTFSKHKIIIVVFILMISLLPIGFYVNLINGIASFSGDILKQRLLDISLTIGEEDIRTAETHIGRRYQRIPFLLTEFIKNPFLGGGLSTGHIFWLDHLSLYGIIGMIPWLYILHDNYSLVKMRLNKTFIYYQIAFIVFIVLGFMKGSGNREQYIILFFILPLGLSLYENGALFKKQ